MSKLRPPFNDKDHYQGDKGTPIELVEYGDYQCPYCGQAYPIVKSIQKKLGKKLKFVFRNFPLEEAHPNAVNAAIASEAAALQGKFWEMHDMLFERQKSLGDNALIKYAAEVGLNTKKFGRDCKGPDCSQKVETDFESGIRSGVNGTPSFYVNGEKYEGSWDEEDEFLSYLTEAARQAKTGK